MSDNEREIKKLRERLTVLTEEAAKNESILRRSQAREMELLKADSLPQLLDLIVIGLSDSLRLNAVTVAICDQHHQVRNLLVASGHTPEIPGVLFVASLAGMAPQFASFRRPWLGPYMESDHRQLFPDAEGLQSVALMPLSRQERLMGSLNFGSPDPQRFTCHHATDFLHHLGTIASFALENAVNRARLVRSGLTDALTGWHNRRYLESRLLEELARAQRDQSPLACMLLDADHFKKVNDNYGHRGGDKVLIELAKRVECQLAADHIAARYGGEEFAILLPNTEIDAALDWAERIREAVSETPIEVGDGQTITVTLSIGISCVVPDGRSKRLRAIGEALRHDADTALYRAKARGRNCVQVHNLAEENDAEQDEPDQARPSRAHPRRPCGLFGDRLGGNEPE